MEEKLSDIEMKIIIHFIENGQRRESYRKFIKSKKITDYQIYSWFLKKEVQETILKMGAELGVYDTVCDKRLLNIINNPMSANKDVVSAIKIWNDLRKRTFLQVQVDQITHLDFSNVSDDNLEKIVNKLMENKIKE